MRTNYIKLLTVFFAIIYVNTTSQVKISTLGTLSNTPDASSVLEMESSNKGVLLPRVALTSNIDIVTVPNPVNGLIVYNTTTSTQNFWEDSKWNRNFTLADAMPYIAQTTNFSAMSIAPTVITGFPTATTLFNFNSSATGWTDLNVNNTITPKKVANTIFVSGEGMVQLNNPSNSNSFQYAIAIFVDNQLKIVRKYKFEDSTPCPWKKFEIDGLFFNLTPNVAHVIKIYGFNLPLTTTGAGYGTSLTYGGNSSTCSNINQDIARIFVTAQLTE